MKIQWSSEAAQEVMDRLKQSDRGLDDGLKQAKAIRSALADANAEGDEKVLTKISERFEACATAMEELMKDLEDFCEAVRRADAEFDEAEKGIVQVVNGLSIASMPPEEAGGAGGGHDWSPESYAQMPEMRIRFATPTWLQAALAVLK